MPPDEWMFVCETLPRMGYTAVDCSKTPRPVVVTTELVQDATDPDWVVYGLTYSGEVYIFVNALTPSEGWSEVRVHEATHYLLTQTYGMAGMSAWAVSPCESEWAARWVGSMYSGHAVDTSWAADYGCTAELAGLSKRMETGQWPG
jgi:hypothetical protein